MRVKVSSGQVFSTDLLQPDELKDLLATIRRERIELTNRGKSKNISRSQAGRLRKAASIKRVQERRIKRMLGYRVRMRQPRKVRRRQRSLRIEQAALALMEKNMKAEQFERLMLAARMRAEQTPLPTMDFRTSQSFEQLQARVADLEAQLRINQGSSRTDRSRHKSHNRRKE